MTRQGRACRKRQEQKLYVIIPGLCTLIASGVVLLSQKLLFDNVVAGRRPPSPARDWAAVSEMTLGMAQAGLIGRSAITSAEPEGNMSAPECIPALSVDGSDSSRCFTGSLVRHRRGCSV